MVEGKRQKQVGKLILEEMNDIFQREGISIVNGGMVSISNVSVTPDLLEARVYLSLFKIEQPEELINKMNERIPEFRNLLGRRVRHQLRRIPELKFFLDDTLDHVFKMEELFKSIKEEPKPGEEKDS